MRRYNKPRDEMNKTARQTVALGVRNAARSYLPETALREMRLWNNGETGHALAPSFDNPTGQWLAWRVCTYFGFEPLCHNTPPRYHIPFAEMRWSDTLALFYAGRRLLNSRHSSEDNFMPADIGTGTEDEVKQMILDRYVPPDEHGLPITFSTLYPIDDRPLSFARTAGVYVLLRRMGGVYRLRKQELLYVDRDHYVHPIIGSPLECYSYPILMANRFKLLDLLGNKE